jgi:hypothetical protein
MISNRIVVLQREMESTIAAAGASGRIVAAILRLEDSYTRFYIVGEALHHMDRTQASMMIPNAHSRIASSLHYTHSGIVEMSVSE